MLLLPVPVAPAMLVCQSTNICLCDSASQQQMQALFYCLWHGVGCPAYYLAQCAPANHGVGTTFAAQQVGRHRLAAGLFIARLLVALLLIYFKEAPF